MHHSRFRRPTPVGNLRRINALRVAAVAHRGSSYGSTPLEERSPLVWCSDESDQETEKLNQRRTLKEAELEKGYLKPRLSLPSDCITTGGVFPIYAAPALALPLPHTSISSTHSSPTNRVATVLNNVASVIRCFFFSIAWLCLHFFNFSTFPLLVSCGRGINVSVHSLH